MLGLCTVPFTVRLQGRPALATQTFFCWLPRYVPGLILEA